MARNPKQDANLKPFHKGDLTSEEAKKRGRVGGVKSGESRRAKRDAKSAVRYLLDLAAKGKIADNLKELGFPSNEQTNMAALIHLSLKKLSEQTGETVHLVQREGTEAVYIDKVESSASSIRMVSRVGSRIPLYCSGVGKALLAELSDEEIRAIWEASRIRRLTPYTITSLDELMERVGEVRKNGFAVDDEENEEGVRCIAVSIRDYHKEPVYALSISAPVGRMTGERMKELERDVLEFKKELAKNLGFRGTGR